MSVYHRPLYLSIHLAIVCIQLCSKEKRRGVGLMLWSLERLLPRQCGARDLTFPFSLSSPQITSVLHPHLPSCLGSRVEPVTTEKVWLFKAVGEGEGGCPRVCMTWSCRRLGTDQEPPLPVGSLHRMGRCQAAGAGDLLVHHDVAPTAFQKEAFGSSPNYLGNL